MIALSFAAVAVATGLVISGACLGVLVAKLWRNMPREPKPLDSLTAKLFGGEVFTAYPLDFDEKENARIWQSIQDRLVVDSLVGASTYGEDK